MTQNLNCLINYPLGTGCSRGLRQLPRLVSSGVFIYLFIYWINDTSDIYWHLFWLFHALISSLCGMIFFSQSTFNKIVHTFCRLAIFEMINREPNFPQGYMVYCIRNLRMFHSKGNGRGLGIYDYCRFTIIKKNIIKKWKLGSLTDYLNSKNWKPNVRDAKYPKIEEKWEEKAKLYHSPGDGNTSKEQFRQISNKGKRRRN